MSVPRRYVDCTSIPSTQVVHCMRVLHNVIHFRNLWHFILSYSNTMVGNIWKMWGRKYVTSFVAIKLFWHDLCMLLVYFGLCYRLVMYFGSFNDFCGCYDNHLSILITGSYFQIGNQTCLIIDRFIYLCNWVSMAVEGIGGWIGWLMAGDVIIVVLCLGLCYEYDLCILGIWFMNLGIMGCTLFYDVGECPKAYNGTTCALDVGCAIWVILCLALLLILLLNFHVG